MIHSGPSSQSRLPIAFLAALILSFAGPVFAAEKESAPGDVETVADQLEYLRGQKKMIARGNVVITYEDVKMTSDYAEIDRINKKAYARGHVVVLRGDLLAAKGEEAHYDFGNDTGSFPNGQTTLGPWFVGGREIRQVKKGKLEIEDAELTSCGLDRPHYVLRAKHLTVYPGDKAIVRSMTTYVLGKPVFWWPYVVIPLQKPFDSPIQIQPGYSSEYGAYILTSKGISFVKQVWGKWHADYRFKRGFGGGLDIGYHFDKIQTDGDIKTYWTQDRRAPRTGLDNPYADREDRDRGRISWRHRTDFNPDTYALLRFHRLADEFFLQDFFEKEFRSDVEPSSFINLTHNTERYGAYVFNQARINEFETVTEKLPEIRFDWKNAPFFSDRVYYESNTSLANLNQNNGRSAADFHAVRADSFHEWTLPMKWNEIKLTPAANFRETLYDRQRFEADAVARTAFGGSVDLRTQFYRLFNTSFDVLGVEANELRHVFEPSVRYDGTWHSSVSSEELHHFDSVDTVDDSNRVTFGLENRIQTKRVINGALKRVDLVSLNTFLSYDFHPDEEYSTSGLSTWIVEAQFRPYSWLQYEVRYDYDMIRDKFREFNQDLVARKNRFHVLFGHRIVTERSFDNARGNNQFVFDAGVWLNDLWQVGAHLRWDAQDHELEEWQISATRDMHDFLLDIGYNVRNSDIDNSNKELFFLFRLKAFPQADLKSGHRASFSAPRLGPTVAGSNTIQAPGYASAEG